MQQDHPSSTHSPMLDQAAENMQPLLCQSTHNTGQTQQQTSGQKLGSDQKQQQLAAEKHQETTHGKEEEASLIKEPQGKQKTERKVQSSNSTLPASLGRLAYFQKGDIEGRVLCDMEYYFQQGQYRKLGSAAFSEYVSIPAKDDPDRRKFSRIFRQMKEKDRYSPAELGLSLRQSRGIAAVLGMAVCDALGASTEFQHFRKEGLGIIKNGFEDIKHGRHGQIGIWTDDASMGLCMADSILLNEYTFDPTNMRYLFNLWLHHGLNNGGRPHSIGLGGNISISMSQFLHHQQPYTFKGDRFNNGNGSLMRLAPVPVAYADNPQKGVIYSGLSSETTHNGHEAAECCRLMGKIIIALINRPPKADGRAVLRQICDNFETECRSVQNLARSQSDDEQLFKQLSEANSKFNSFNKQLKDRDWNWRSPTHTYSPTRLKQQPGYVGSYCMDALTMALHTVWFTGSFKQVAIMNADMGGDCDTVGSIAGQIAGAMYGVDEGMLGLYSQMADFRKERYEVFVKGHKLINKKRLQ